MLLYESMTSKLKGGGKENQYDMRRTDTFDQTSPHGYIRLALLGIISSVAQINSAAVTYV